MDRALSLWLEESGFSSRSVLSLAGDLSQRRYFRVVLANGESLLAAYYPPDLRVVQRRFIASHALLREAGIAVPEILASNEISGFMALEDLGEETVHDQACSGRNIEAFITDALAHGRRIAALDPEAVDALGGPPLDSALLSREVDLTFEHLFEPCGIDERPDLAAAFRSALHELCRRLGDGPLVPCHRDFMVRNLMPRGADRVVVLDFQDLRLGPASYDLASLLNDSWRASETAEAEIVTRALPRSANPDAYPMAVVQRCVKAAGTFARFAARGDRRHLVLVPPTLARAAAHLARLSETRELFSRLRPWWIERLSDRVATGSFC